VDSGDASAGAGAVNNPRSLEDAAAGCFVAERLFSNPAISNPAVKLLDLLAAGLDSDQIVQAYGKRFFFFFWQIAVLVLWRRRGTGLFSTTLWILSRCASETQKWAEKALFIRATIFSDWAQLWPKWRSRTLAVSRVPSMKLGDDALHYSALLYRAASLVLYHPDVMSESKELHRQWLPPGKMLTDDQCAEALRLMIEAWLECPGAPMGQAVHKRLVEVIVKKPAESMRAAMSKHLPELSRAFLHNCQLPETVLAALQGFEKSSFEFLRSDALSSILQDAASPPRQTPDVLTVTPAQFGKRLSEGLKGKKPPYLISLFCFFLNRVRVRYGVWDSMLPDSVTLSCTSPCSLLANIHLCNTSMIRYERQQQQTRLARMDVPDEEVLLKKKLGPPLDRIDKKTVQRAFRFPHVHEKHSALVDQTLTVKRCRTEVVKDVGTYATVAEEMGNLLKLINEDLYRIFRNYHTEVCDADLASWIRAVFDGESLDRLWVVYVDAEDDEYLPALDASLMDDVKSRLVSWTYLLFGCEVARNPAALLQHHMMLDLIILAPDDNSFHRFLCNRDEQQPPDKKTKKKNQKQDGVDPLLPMAMTGAVAASRAWLRFFSTQKLMESYRYDRSAGVIDLARKRKSIADTGRIRELCLRGHALWERWHAAVGVAIKECLLPTGSQSAVEACKRWFGLTCRFGKSRRTSRCRKDEYTTGVMTRMMRLHGKLSISEEEGPSKAPA